MIKLAHYNLAPEIKIESFTGVWAGYEAIAERLLAAVKDRKSNRTILGIECYPGVRNEELAALLISLLSPNKVVFADDTAMDGTDITEMVQRTLTDDRVFGVMSHYELHEFFPEERLKKARQEIAEAEGLVIVYGTGTSVIVKPDILVYADLARWEIQCRYRKEGMPNWKADNENEDALRKFKRGYFFEWRTADRHKSLLYSDVDFLLDTNVRNEPKMVSGEDYRAALKQVVSGPFRVVPYFDASVWGGQWMKERFNLDPGSENYGWAFDGVPEENSLYLNFGGVRIEVPSINIVRQHPNELLGEKVRSRFGTEFPIRFDYLDTMGGGNLSLQVHPLVEYAQEKFGVHYTQDESYYILDSTDRSTVYLGVKEGTTKDELIEDLKKAAKGDYHFPDEKYINIFPVKKHDHILIPAGTIHCGGPDTVVLEISATPYIFTFKLWDWGRTGLDGLPRPVHLEHGSNNVQMHRNTKWVEENLINCFETLSTEDGVRTERTGLHELEFIETQRHWFMDKVTLETHNSVNMLNLVEGESAIVESPDGTFDPFEVHYGETFIVPECVKSYTVTNTSSNPNLEIALIQAFVRNL
ncbi:putative mannose-6-phosphate isomerase YvyI [compost metagenome]